MLELEDGAEMFIPKSAVVFLRADSKDVKDFRIYINYPEGRVSYRVPVLRIKDYDLDEIFGKKLLLLLPFYVFNISDKELDEMERDLSKLDRLIAVLEDINIRLQNLVDEEEIDEIQKGTIKQYIKDVLEKMMEKRKNAKKGVEDYMGGYIIETIYDKVLREKDELNKALEEKEKALEKEKNENKSLREELEKYRKQGIVIS